MNLAAPLDSTITGWGYQYATSSLEFLEKGPQSKGGMPPEMLCTLDNFVRVVLFSERVFVTQVPTGGHPVNAQSGASAEAKSLFEMEGIFIPLVHRGEKDAVTQNISRARQTLSPVEMEDTQFRVISYKDEASSWVFYQEMLVQDAVLIEDAISQVGLQCFKPIFPGDALYLGLRESRMPGHGASQNITDIATKKIRGLVKARMDRLNETVVLGSPPLPTLPPLFLNRILHDCTSGADIASKIVDVRNSSAAKRFRNWASQCMEWIASDDFVERAKAMDAYESLVNLNPKAAMTRKDWAKEVLYVGTNAIDAVSGSPSGAIEALGSRIIDYVVGLPFSLLDQLGKGGDATQAFLKENFGEVLNPADLYAISIQLNFPETTLAWKETKPQFEVSSKRMSRAEDSFSRPWSIELGDDYQIQKIASWFEEISKSKDSATSSVN